MGNLIQFSLGPEEDHALYFQVLLELGASMRDVAALGLTCSLARIWCRQQMRLASMTEILRLAARLEFHGIHHEAPVIPWREIQSRNGVHPLEWNGDSSAKIGDAFVVFVCCWVEGHYSGDWLKISYDRYFEQEGFPGFYTYDNKYTSDGDEGNLKTFYTFTMFDDLLRPRFAPPVPPMPKTDEENRILGLARLR
jgi:hypothetical protein